MVALGIASFTIAVAWILLRFYSHPRPYAFPRGGYIAAAALVLAEIFLFAGIEPVPTYFTAIAWTAYVFWADSAIFALRGESPWQTYRVEFLLLALCSIPLWLIFEAYNLRLENWVYVGLPPRGWERNIGYAWSFATIWPAIFETAILLRTLRRVRQAATASSLSEIPAPRLNAPHGAPLMALAGGLLLVLPLVVPAQIASYLFGAVWLGFIFLLEPINYRTGAESLWRDVQRRDFSRVTALLGSGLICGIFWEFWNYWARARWVYIFPMAQDWKLFAMPLPGFLGFPPFAIECFVLFAFVTRALTALGIRRRPVAAANWAVLKL